MLMVKYGSKGDAVKELQKLLGIAADGIFGKNTLAAVKAYQNAHGLEADGIVGKQTWASLKGETIVLGDKPVDYKQYDSRWGSIKYSTHTSKQTIRNSGCGVTAMADIIATWFDDSITPKEMAALAVKKGYRTYNAGTSWGFFDYIAKQYPFAKYARTKNHTVAIQALEEGALCVASMAPGYWTSGGHFICLWKCDGTYMYANDPASAKRTKQKLSQFKKEVKQYFVFWPPVSITKEEESTISGENSEEKNVISEQDTRTEEQKMYVPGTGIYDVSKWQGKISWEKVAKSGKVALMILRAGYGQETVDPRFDYNATECIEYGIPFAVYWYSYATNEQMAENEMVSFWNTAAKYNPLWWAVDCEERNLKGSYINASFRKLREMGAKKIVPYIANHLFSTYKADTSLVDGVWIPRYSKTPPSHRPCDLWQYGGSKVDGITSGKIDTNKIPESGRYDLKWFLSPDV